MNWIIIVGLVVVLIIVVVIAVFSLINLDLMSYTATGSETISPAGTSTGHALVVYAPGISGEGKNMATKIASDLRTKGYSVELAGIRSGTAANASGYDVIIVGGPIYFGKVSSSVDAYLKTLKLQKDVKLGVFGTTGSKEFNNNDIASFGQQVTSLPGNSPLNKKAVTKTIRMGDAGNTDCSDLVSAVLQ
jgi:flavodoxin